MSTQEYGGMYYVERLKIIDPQQNLRGNIHGSASGLRSPGAPVREPVHQCVRAGICGGEGPVPGNNIRRKRPGGYTADMLVRFAAADRRGKCVRQ